MELDMPLLEPKPPIPLANSNALDKAKYDEYERANCLSMTRSMFDTIKGSLCSCDTGNDFLDVVDEKFQESDKAEVGSLMNSIINDKYDMFADVEFSL